MGRAWGARGGLRLAVLAFAALIVSHEVAYHAHHGGGAELEQRMASLGHDSYWPALTLLALSGAVVLGLLGVARIVRLWLRGRSIGLESGLLLAGGGYRRELIRLWSVLFPITATGFAVQENIEHLAAGKGLIWLEALGLGGHEYPLALPALGLITLLVAAAGAALRWQAASLEERIARALWQQLLRPIEADSPPVAWLIVAALCAHRWTGTRFSLHRGPPLTLPI